jgi:hypothetical protein
VTPEVKGDSYGDRLTTRSPRDSLPMRRLHARRLRAHYNGIGNIAVVEMAASAQRQHRRNTFEKLRALLVRHLRGGRHDNAQLGIAKRDHVGSPIIASSSACTAAISLRTIRCVYREPHPH